MQVAELLSPLIHLSKPWQVDDVKIAEEFSRVDFCLKQDQGALWIAVRIAAAATRK